MNSNKGKHLLITALSAVNMLCMPILSYHRGLFPSDPLSIFDMLETSAGDYKKFALMLLVPTIGMLIFALMDNGGLFKLSSLVGVVWTGINIFTRAADEGFDTILSEDTSIGIGAWIGLALFIWGFASSETGDNEAAASGDTNAAGGAKKTAGFTVTKAAGTKTTATKTAGTKTTATKTTAAKTAATKTTATKTTATAKAGTQTKTAAKPAKKRCPICGTSNPADAAKCSQCGIVL